MTTEVEQVRVFNSEIRTHYFLYIRPDRLREFYQAVLSRRPTATANTMPGLSWGAILGLDAIFDRRPKKFPIDDILLWLRDSLTTYTGETPAPAVTKDEIEKALEQFSTTYPPDVSVTEDA